MVILIFLPLAILERSDARGASKSSLRSRQDALTAFAALRELSFRK
jgi:hypothetical protein